MTKPRRFDEDRRWDAAAVLLGAFGIATCVLTYRRGRTAARRTMKES